MDSAIEGEFRLSDTFVPDVQCDSYTQAVYEE